MAFEMAPKLENFRDKKQRKSLSLEVKLEILKRHDAGERQKKICTVLGLAGSTVRSILKSREKIKEFSKTATPLSATQITRTRSTIMVNMERLLSVWLEDQTQRRIPITLFSVQAKALSLHERLQKDLPPGTKVETFKASHGWFDRFKRRSQLHNIIVSGEAISSNVEGAATFKETFARLVEENSYSPQQVFNVDECGLFWKRMPKRKCVTDKEKMSGFKGSKNRLTLLVGGNASGDFKLKPLVIYQSENPRALEGYSKSSLPVIWKSNRKAWVTRDIFEDWFSHHFCPTVKEYCSRNNLAHKVLLLLDNAPGHPTTLNEFDEHVKVLFLPPNTTSILQPMDQGLITTFKAYYLRQIFDQAIRKTDDENAPSFIQFWKEYNIRNAIENIGMSWAEVTFMSMNGIWRKLWPACVLDSLDFESFDDIIQQVTKDIVNLGRSLGFDDLEASDISDFLDSHQESLSNDDLIELEQQRALEEDQEEDEPAETKAITTANINEIFKLQDAVFACIMKHDPKIERSSMVIRNLEQALSCYKVLLEEKMEEAKQAKLNSFFLKSPWSSSATTVKTQMPGLQHLKLEEICPHLQELLLTSQLMNSPNVCQP